MEKLTITSTEVVKVLKEEVCKLVVTVATAMFRVPDSGTIHFTKEPIDLMVAEIKAGK
jgi:hypothetical protein